MQVAATSIARPRRPWFEKTWFECVIMPGNRPDLAENLPRINVGDVNDLQRLNQAIEIFHRNKYVPTGSALFLASMPPRGALNARGIATTRARPGIFYLHSSMKLEWRASTIQAAHPPIGN